MSLTKLGDIPAGDGKMANLFYSVLDSYLAQPADIPFTADVLFQNMYFKDGVIFSFYV